MLAATARRGRRAAAIPRRCCTPCSPAAALRCRSATVPWRHTWACAAGRWAAPGCAAAAQGERERVACIYKHGEVPGASRECRQRTGKLLYRLAHGDSGDDVRPGGRPRAPSIASRLSGSVAQLDFASAARPERTPMSSCAAVSQAAALRGPARPSRSSRRSCAALCAQQDPLLLRVARGEGGQTGGRSGLAQLPLPTVPMQLCTAGWMLGGSRSAVSRFGFLDLLPAGCHSCRTRKTLGAPPPASQSAAAEAERTPVWLMRQAGRYMAAFREYSDRIGFRERSETASIAIELSLQPWRAFQVRPAAVPATLQLFVRVVQFSAGIACT